jgi:DNA-binding transcriptional LysR family regulator
MLEAGELDLLPSWLICPPRFVTRPVVKDRLVAATKARHPYAVDPRLDTYCAARHRP